MKRSEMEEELQKLLSFMYGAKTHLEDSIYILNAIDEMKPRVKTFCKDCGVETKAGKGAARCKECWEDRCGNGKTR